MGRAPCCDKANVKKGPWSPDEDAKLKDYIEKYGTGGNWIALPQKAGLKRCGKSCRLRWLNYLRPNIKHGEFSEEEDRIICSLYASIGSRWSIIASQLPGRTDNDIKNYWNTKLKKKLMATNSTTPNLINHNNITQRKPHLNNHNQYTNLLHNYNNHQYPLFFSNNHYPSSLSSSPSSSFLSASTLNPTQCTSTYYNTSLPNNIIMSFTHGNYNDIPTASSLNNNALIPMQDYQQQQVKDNSTLLVFDGALDHHHHHHHHHHNQQQQQPSSCSSDDGSCSVITQINNNQVKQEDQQFIYGVHHHHHNHEENQGKRLIDHHDEQYHANPIGMMILMDENKPSLCVNAGNNNISSSNMGGLWGQNSQSTSTCMLDYGLEEIKQLISTNNINVENNFTYYDEAKEEEKDTNDKVMYNYY